MPAGDWIRARSAMRVALDPAIDSPFRIPGPLQDPAQLLLARAEFRHGLGAPQLLGHRLERHCLAVQQRRQGRVLDDRRFQRSVRPASSPECRPGRVAPVVPLRPTVSIAVVSRRGPGAEGEPQRTKALFQEGRLTQKLVNLECQDGQERRAEESGSLPSRTRSGIDFTADSLAIPETSQHVRRCLRRRPEDLSQGGVGLQSRRPIPSVAVVATVARRRETVVRSALAHDRQARAERPRTDQADQGVLLR
jgi:hypothetical protein